MILSGGSARGLAHIGFLEALEENHIPIDAIVGSSMGAMIGGLYASGALGEFKKDILKLSDNKIMTLFLSKKLKKMNRDSNSDLGPFLSKYLKNKNIEDLGIAFTAVATDLKSGKEVFIENGNLQKAILASICLPGIFKPIEMDNKILVDGSVIDPLPQNYGQLIAKKVISVNAIPKEYQYYPNSETMFDVLSEASGIMSNMLMSLKNIMELKNISQDNFIFIQLDTEKIGPFDFERSSEIIALGKTAAENNMKNIIELVKK